MDTSDDAGVYRLRDDLGLVQTIDFITPVVDDPYHFGQIAAANSLSDVYAMGGRAISVLNVVAYPTGKLPMDVVAEVLRGGAEKCREAGVPIIGGHTVDDPEPKYGLSVVGTVDPAHIITNAGAKIGDQLVLTKAIGTGIISTAIKVDKAPTDLVQRAIASMITLNRAASEAMLAVGVNACTDITGFGLMGHLYEMCCGAAVRARVSLSAVPVFSEAYDLLDSGIVPGGTYANQVYLEKHITYAPGITNDQQLLLCDAQTSGGLLIAVPAERTSALLTELNQHGVHIAAVIGEIIPGEPGTIEVTH
jgi:selenide,water dikinase